MRRCYLTTFLSAVIWTISCADTPPKAPVIDKTAIPSSGASLFETFEDAQLRQDHQQALALRASLERLPGVIEARIHLTTPKTPLFGPPSKENSGAAILLFRDNPTEPTVQMVESFVLAAHPSLQPDTVHIQMVQSPAPRSKPTVSIGPIEVTAASAGITRYIIGGLLLICVLSSAGLIAAGVKLIRLRSLGTRNP